MYAGSKLSLVKEADITKVFEVRDLEEFTEEWLLEQLALRKWSDAQVKLVCAIIGSTFCIFEHFLIVNIFYLKFLAAIDFFSNRLPFHLKALMTTRCKWNLVTKL